MPAFLSEILFGLFLSISLVTIIWDSNAEERSRRSNQANHEAQGVRSPR